jgi:UDP-4-amino-4,6-dideoxy-N-acetyl-beta-L-altrosamine transaminase
MIDKNSKVGVKGEVRSLPYGRQHITEDDIAAVEHTLRSDLITTGPRAAEFEKRFADHVGAKHAIAVSNATCGLHLAMRAANIGAGDRVVTTPNTFLASANCAAFVGAVPDFADIDPQSYNLCPQKLADSWQDDTRAVVAVHYGGQTADMPGIAAVAHQRGAVVIEDACHAVGGRFEHKGQEWKVGGHQWADMTTFSFHPVKTMTTGEGGMLVTDNDEYAATARRLRSHGMVRGGGFVGLGTDQFAEQGPWYYEMQELGYNYRITDFQCALGMSQLARLEELLDRRREIVSMYNAAFAGHEMLEIPRLRNPADEPITSWHLYTALIDFAAVGLTRTEVMRKLLDRGIGTQVLYIPVYLQPWYRNQYGYSAGKCPTAESYYARTLSFPLFPRMTDGDVAYVIESVNEVLGRRKA